MEGETSNSRLVVQAERGEVLIPLALDICTAIDTAAKRIVIDPPSGLLEVNEPRGGSVMRFDVVTIFPAMVQQALGAGIVGRAIERGTLNVVVHDLRDFTTDRHRVVDDVPYGGGPGMVLKPEPLFRALDAIESLDESRPTVLLTSPQGTLLTQRVVERLSRQPSLVLLCGRYEGRRRAGPIAGRRGTVDR